MKNNRHTTFYLVRHGETDWNKNRIIQGQKDILLNEVGETQAKVAAKIFKNIPFDLAFSSDLFRAKRTAEVIALEHKLAVQTTHLLRERHFGSLQGKPTQTLLMYSKKLSKLSLEDRMKHKFEDAESDEEIATRVFTFLRETAVAYPGKNILVGTHGGVLRIILIHLGIVTYEKYENMRFVNGGYIKLTSDGVDFFVDKTHGFEARQKGTSDL